jgi:hypothetical protein
VISNVDNFEKLVISLLQSSQKQLVKDAFVSFKSANI